MRFKLSFFAITLILLTHFASAQNSKSVIEARFNEYLTALVSKDFNKAMNYLPDDFFKIVPKNHMIEALEKAFNTPGVEFELRMPKIMAIGDVFQEEKKYYSLLKYSNIMIMKIRDGEDNLTKEEKENKFNVIQNSLNNSFGAENVKLNEKDDSFEIYSEKDAYAVSNDGKTNWRFLVLEKDQKPILKKLLPAKLYQKI